jgi:hypothetical protein
MRSIIRTARKVSLGLFTLNTCKRVSTVLCDPHGKEKSTQNVMQTRSRQQPKRISVKASSVKSEAKQQRPNLVETKAKVIASSVSSVAPRPLRAKTLVFTVIESTDGSDCDVSVFHAHKDAMTYALAGLNTMIKNAAGSGIKISSSSRKVRDDDGNEYELHEWHEDAYEKSSQIIMSMQYVK